MENDIKHEDNKFVLIIDGYESQLSYDMYDEETIVFYHTYVPEGLRGRGLAKKLISEGLEWAMSKSYKIIPTCSAVQRMINTDQRYKEYMLS